MKHLLRLFVVNLTIKLVFSKPECDPIIIKRFRGVLLCMPSRMTEAKNECIREEGINPNMDVTFQAWCNKGYLRKNFRKLRHCINKKLGPYLTQASTNLRRCVINIFDPCHQDVYEHTKELDKCMDPIMRKAKMECAQQMTINQDLSIALQTYCQINKRNAQRKMRLVWQCINGKLGSNRGKYHKLMKKCYKINKEQKAAKKLLEKKSKKKKKKKGQ